MVKESLSRKFRPAGFDQPEGSRHEYTKPRPELQEAFDKWIEELPEGYIIIREKIRQYEKACKAIQHFREIPYQEANSLLAGFKPKTEGQKDAGLFISACYTHFYGKIIISDVDAPEIHYIGYEPRYKTNPGFANIIFNNGKAGHWFADGFSGIIVNNGESMDSFAHSFLGMAVNNGKFYGNFVWKYRESEWFGDKEITLKQEDFDRIPELKEYMEELSEITKSIKDEKSAKKLFERYGSCPQWRIRGNIRGILEKG